MVPSATPANSTIPEMAIIFILSPTALQKMTAKRFQPRPGAFHFNALYDPCVTFHIWAKDPVCTTPTESFRVANPLAIPLYARIMAGVMDQRRWMPFHCMA